MVNVGILTTRHVHTPHFIHTLKKRGDIKVSKVWDPDARFAEKYAGELGVAIAGTYEEVLSDTGIQAVVITGMTREHDELAVAAANAGKHLFVEKPLATTAAEAGRIFSAVRESRVIFQTGHFVRSMSSYRFAKQEIEEGNLGIITRARHSNGHHGALAGWLEGDNQWFVSPEKAGGGGLMDLGCHSVDLLVFLFGHVESTTAALGPKTIRYPDIDEYGEGLLRFKSGVLGTIAGSWVDAANPITFFVTGTEGHLSVIQGQVFYFSSKTRVPGADGKTPIDPKYLPDALPHAFDLFLDVLVGKRDRSVLVPIGDAMNVARTMHGMYLGDKLGQWVRV